MESIPRPLALAAALLAALAGPAHALTPLDTFDSVPGRKPEPTRSVPGGVAPVRFVLQLGYDVGRFETGYFGGTYEATTGLHFNDGVGFAAGVDLSLPGTGAGLRATLGFKRASIESGGERLVALAFPLEAIAWVQLDPVRLGVGGCALVGTSLTSDGVAGIDLPVAPGPGLVLTLAWVAPFKGSPRGAQSALGVRYVYQQVEIYGQTFDASAVGAVLDLSL